MHRGHVEHLLTAYVHNELPPHLRRRVARHVDRCDRCYAALRREQELTRSLRGQFTGFGQPRSDQLTRLLPDILAEAKPRTRRPRLLPGFGVALVMSLVLALLLPVLMTPQAMADYAPDQPAPYMIAATATQSVTDAPQALVLASPTAVARWVEEAATDPPDQNPPPAPVAQATPEID